MAAKKRTAKTAASKGKASARQMPPAPAPKIRKVPRATRTAPRGLYGGPIELEDSTPDRPVVALHHLDGRPVGFAIGRSLEGDALYVANVARRRAKDDPGDEFLVGCARVLAAVHLAVRRHRTGLEASDRAFVVGLEASARPYLDTAQEGERWYGGGVGLARVKSDAEGRSVESKIENGKGSDDGFPARKRVDRVTRIDELADFARKVVLRGNRSPETMAIMMVSTVWRTGIIKTKVSRDDAQRELVRTLRLPRNAGKPAVDRLMAWTLKACGVGHTAAENWCAALV